MSGALIDSCLLIDHLRAKDKTKTPFADVLIRCSEPSISTIVEYEVEVGMTDFHRELWSSIRTRLKMIPFESPMVVHACKIKHQLKAIGKQIGPLDLFIAATAIDAGLPLATLNRKHFEPIDGLELFLPEKFLDRQTEPGA